MKLLHIMLFLDQLCSAGTAEVKTPGEGASLEYLSASSPNILDHCIFLNNLCSPTGDVEGGGTQGSERVGPRRSTQFNAEPRDLAVRGKIATICGSDIRILRRRKTVRVRHPSIKGYEFAGAVVEGTVEFSVGTRVGV